MNTPSKRSTFLAFINIMIVMIFFLLSSSATTTATTSTTRIINSRSRIFRQPSSEGLVVDQKHYQLHSYKRVQATAAGKINGDIQNSWNKVSRRGMQSPPPPAPAASMNNMIITSCYQFQRIRHCPPIFLSPPSPPAPPSEDYEIDPRYGVEKRLVPSGPNPLHN